MLGVKNLSVGICNGAPSTARSSYVLNKQKTCAPLAFDEIENKKVASSVLGEIKTCLPLLFFKKKWLENTYLFFL